MAKLLHIIASPRAESYSTQAAEKFIAEVLKTARGVELETLDLTKANLPAFDAPSAKAKYAIMSGAAPQGPAEKAWARVKEIIDHFKSASAYVISSPMWNFGVPYYLKQYIDIIAQPGMSFGYSPEKGYEGLITGRPAVLFLARGSEYPPGAAMDFQRPYLEFILKFIGIKDIRTFLIEPTLMAGPDTANAKLRDVINDAASYAKTFMR